jgi:hypothetical protein
LNLHSDSLIGLSGTIDEISARELALSIRLIWKETMKKEPGDLQDDLALCRRWFDPVAQGQRLRRELSELNEFPEAIANPGPPFTLEVASGKYLVTPEGRCALDLLEKLPADSAAWFIDSSTQAYYDRTLAVIYQSWSRHRIDSVIALLEGKTKPLQIPAAGVVIALLVNGSVSEERAMIRFAAERPRELVDKAFFSAVNAFADILSPSRRGSRSSTLISGWMLYEVRRRVGEGLVIEDFGVGQDGRVWIKAGREADIIDVIARDLARGHRSKVSTDGLATAFDALVSELRRQLSSLAGFGLSHEQPTETRRLRSRILTSFAGYLGLWP